MSIWFRCNNGDVFDSQVCANGGLVLITESLVDVLVHQRSLSHTTVPEDNDLEYASTVSIGYDRAQHSLAYFEENSAHDSRGKCGDNRGALIQCPKIST
jgi:hypothetical protein